MADERKMTVTEAGRKGGMASHRRRTQGDEEQTSGMSGEASGFGGSDAPAAEPTGRAGDNDQFR